MNLSVAFRFNHQEKSLMSAKFVFRNVLNEGHMKTTMLCSK